MNKGGRSTVFLGTCKEGGINERRSFLSLQNGAKKDEQYFPMFFYDIFRHVKIWDERYGFLFF